ncbi:deaminase [Lithospermum erythrorhizon]|uniref:Deaminase n=1 Tax=Lithospermum erythrorhizon TaxID=34254 RepID=A0AAV3QNY9_LITER
MRLQMVPRNVVFSTLKREFHYEVSGLGLDNEEFVYKLLDRRWALSSPESKIHQVFISDKCKEGDGVIRKVSYKNNPHPSLGDVMVERNPQQPSFYVVRDDLRHPLVNGNKARKLDALLPFLEDHSITDVVTCGGLQSAHTAAVAVSCSERGLKAHLLVRGEQPQILTGYALISTLYGHVKYVPRSLYAKREDMLLKHAEMVAHSGGSVLHLNDLLRNPFKLHSLPRDDISKFNAPIGTKKVAIVNEGAGDAVALLGVIRLVQFLSQKHLFGNDQKLKIVIDAGTGTTATGLGLGAELLGLPWEVIAIMLADTVDGYREKEKSLISEFCSSYQSSVVKHNSSRINNGIVQWVQRTLPRKFGNILDGEIQECQRIARQTGILVDPVYTLAAWELASKLSFEDEDAKVLMIHTGGTLGMFGLAQRYKSCFQGLNESE